MTWLQIIGTFLTMIAFPLLAYLMRGWINGDKKKEAQAVVDKSGEATLSKAYVDTGNQVIDENQSIQKQQAAGEGWLKDKI